MNTMNLNNLKSDLITALQEFSEGKLSYEVAEKVATKSMNSFDINNSSLVHKGTNWYAKEILKVLKI